MHYVMEKRDRRLFRLNVQLKKAYRAQQKAQMKESEAAASKRRFVSYIFHEVRVPLNTAMLAYQNLLNHGTFSKDDPEAVADAHALDLSHTMMKTVLNDVLDLQRIDSGKFELKFQSFSLHRDIDSTLASARSLCAAKGLELRVDLDPAIDALQQSASSEGLWIVGTF
jgi:signal transduction histidine kinase